MSSERGNDAQNNLVLTLIENIILDIPIGTLVA